MKDEEIKNKTLELMDEFIKKGVDVVSAARAAAMTMGESKQPDNWSLQCKIDNLNKRVNECESKLTGPKAKQLREMEERIKRLESSASNAFWVTARAELRSLEQRIEERLSALEPSKEEKPETNKQNFYGEVTGTLGKVDGLEEKIVKILRDFLYCKGTKPIEVLAMEIISLVRNDDKMVSVPREAIVEIVTALDCNSFSALWSAVLDNSNALKQSLNDGKGI